MMGIRTPWTLTSDLSWDRTHRVGGRLFVLEGIVVVLVLVFACSYTVWKADPAKRQA